jgi:uncharacterized protein
MNYRTALITGASSGIGEVFARQLAAASCDLILVSRSGDKLQRLADRLTADHDRRVEVIAADLSQPAPGAALAAAVAQLGMEVDLLVNNAGFGTVGAFHKQDPAREQQEIALNAAAVVDLAHAFVPGMVQRGSGGIINVASVAAFQPVPRMAVYAATKAFVLSFSLGLWGEYRGRGLRVVAVCPGPVDTNFFDATGNAKLRSSVPDRIMLSPESVVAGSLKALARGDTVYVPGATNKLTALGGKLLPRQWITRLAGMAMQR